MNGLPPLGQQIAVDATLVSPLKRTGEARPQAHCKDGVALAEARKDKERKYPELLTGTRCRLVVVAMEVGGRWSEEAHYFLEALAEARSAYGNLSGGILRSLPQKRMPFFKRSSSHLKIQW